ncbi:MAG: hypothetical protein ACI8PD_000176 [Nitrospinales bacterium]|jgi:hypothetical protein
MKSYKSILPFFLIFTLLLGLIAGCSFTPEKKLRGNGFTLMFKSKSAGGYALADIKLASVQVSEGEILRQLRSIQYEELALFGKKKAVFTREQANRIGRLIAKALNKSSGNKIIYYELDTPDGTTEGDVFANGKVLNWRFSSIQGREFSSRSFNGWGGSNWRLLPSSGQRYHSTGRLLGQVAKENWIKVALSRDSAREFREEKEYRDSAPSRKPRKQRRVRAEPSRKQAPAPTRNNSADTELEKKLQFLKGLYDKNLVDEEEYNRKRKELLDTYL